MVVVTEAAAVEDMVEVDKVMETVVGDMVVEDTVAVLAEAMVTTAITAAVETLVVGFECWCYLCTIWHALFSYCEILSYAQVTLEEVVVVVAAAAATMTLETTTTSHQILAP